MVGGAPANVLAIVLSPQACGETIVAMGGWLPSRPWRSGVEKTPAFQVGGGWSLSRSRPR